MTAKPPSLAGTDRAHDLEETWWIATPASVESAIAAARCTVHSETDVPRAFLGLPPVYSSLPLCEAYAFVHRRTASALLRLRGRPESDASVGMVAAGASAMGSGAMHLLAQPPRYDLPRVGLAARAFMPMVRSLLLRAPDRAALRIRAAAAALTPPLMTSYRCADGRRLYVFAIDHDALPRRFLEALGLMDALGREGLEDRDAYAPEDGPNLRESANWPARLRRTVRRRIAKVLKGRAAEDWERELGGRGLPCAVVRTTQEFLARPELAAAGVTEPGPDGRPRPGPLVWIEAGPSNGPAQRRPLGGQGLLSGLRVLDLSSMIAGPVAARTLGDYGASVTKIVPPRPRHGPRMTCWYAVDVDAGKRSIALDPTTPGGAKAMHRLLAECDVVVHNFTDDATRRLGLSPEALAHVAPDAVICRIGAFRGPRPGPWNDRRGYDPVLQAASGIMARYGTMERPEHHAFASCIDYLTGYSGALAVAQALEARAYDPEARLRVASTSLVQNALLIQGRLLDPDANALAPSGPDAKGLHALHRLYRLRDGWALIAGEPGGLAEVARRTNAPLPSGARATDRPAADAFARVFSRHRCEQLRRLLHGLAEVEPLAHFDDWRRAARTDLKPGDPVAEDAPDIMMTRAPHPAGGVAETLVPTFARIPGAPLRVRAPAAKPGSDTRQVLEEVGLTGAEIDDMFARGEAADGIADAYLPP